MLNSSLQQKRAGDWLQVLLCNSIKDKSRGFRQYPDGRENITKKIQRVFFVTHDRIALAFALLNGIDVIFTHHNCQQHFHSAFVYKLNDPIKERQDKINLANDYKLEFIPLKQSIDNLISKINSYQSDKYETFVSQKNKELELLVDQI